MLIKVQKKGSYFLILFNIKMFWWWQRYPKVFGWFHWVLWNWSKGRRLSQCSLCFLCACSSLRVKQSTVKVRQELQGKSQWPQQWDAHPAAWCLVAGSKIPQIPCWQQEQVYLLVWPVQTGMRTHSEICYKRAVHYHIFQKLFMSRRAHHLELL